MYFHPFTFTTPAPRYDIPYTQNLSASSNLRALIDTHPLTQRAENSTATLPFAIKRKQSSFDAFQDEPPQEKGYVSSSSCYAIYEVLTHDSASRFFKDSPNPDEQTANAEFSNLSADFDAGIVVTGGRGGDGGSGESGAATMKKKREYTFLFLSAISM